jgi:putative transport protein
MLDTVRQALAHTPLALLFVTIALGALLGRFHVRGVGLGVAAVLFAGLAAGAWGGPAFELPAIIGQFGLALFVYVMGLEAGAPFIGTIRQHGAGLTALALVAVLGAALPAWLGVKFFGLAPALAVGLFCGAGTNTPALAAVSDLLGGGAAAALPTVGYAMAYPLAVILPLLLTEGIFRLRHIDLKAESRKAEDRAGIPHDPPVASNLVVAVASAHGQALVSLGLAALPVQVSRVLRGHQVLEAANELVLQPGDIVHVVGASSAVAAARALIGPDVAGTVGPEDLRSEVDVRRIILSRHSLVGRRIDELGFKPEWGAVVTRVRRGDADFVPTAATKLELGDRLRVVVCTPAMEAVTQYLGDSFRALGELDLVSLALGLAAGLAFGSVRLKLGGGVTLTLGQAGGPLVVALVLGAIGRTGPVLWHLPPAAALALRQLGLTVFFAWVGLRAGHQFEAALAGQGWLLMGLGALGTLAATVGLLCGARVLLRLDWVTVLGLMAGGQTQPALLAYAEERTRTEAVDLAYAAILPVATIAKILTAQLLLPLLAALSR